MALNTFWKFKNVFENTNIQTEQIDNVKKVPRKTALSYIISDNYTSVVNVGIFTLPKRGSYGVTWHFGQVVL